MDRIDFFYQLGALILGPNSQDEGDKVTLSKIFLGYWLISGREGPTGRLTSTKMETP